MQISIFNWIISTGYIFVIITVIFFVLLTADSSGCRILLLLLLLWRPRGLSSILLSSSHIVHIYLIVLLLTLYFLAIIDVDSEIIGLVLKFLAFNLFWLGASSCLRRSWVLLSGIGIAIVFNVIDILTVIETFVIVEIQLFTTLLSELVILIFTIHFFKFLFYFENLLCDFKYYSDFKFRLHLFEFFQGFGVLGFWGDRKSVV